MPRPSAATSAATSVAGEPPDDSHDRIEPADPVDPVVGAASAVVGGPRGRYARPSSRGGATAGPLLALGAAVAVAVSALLRSHCRTTGWASPDQLVHACYSDVASRVASGTVAQQPPGAALTTEALTALGRALGGPDTPGSPDGPAVWTFDLSAVLGALALALAALALVALTRRRGRPWAASALALSPLVVVSGLVSLELLAVGFVALGLLAHARGAPAACGAAIAAAATVDPLAAVVLLALWTATLGARGAGALRPVVSGAAGALGVLLSVAAAWVVSGLAFEAARGAGALPEADLSLTRVLTAWAPDWGPVAGYGSLWLLPSLPGALGTVPGPAVVAGALVGTLAAVALVAVLARRWDAVPHGPGPARLALGAVALVMLTAPTVPLQSSLLLLPLVVAAGLPWRLTLPWALVECAAGVITWLYVYGQEVPARGAEPWTYAVAVVVRLGAVAVLAVWALRQQSTDAAVETTPAAP